MQNISTEQDVLRIPTRLVRDYLSDSRPWNDFMAQGGFVSGDIVVVDPFKAGTTWTQRIVQQILANGEEPEGGLSNTSPWLDSSWGNHTQMLQTLQEQRMAGKRRVLKSHVAADALPIDSKSRYIFVGRNGKDLGNSFHNYLKNFTPETMAEINRIHAEWSSNHTPLEIPENLQDFFDLWLNTDGYGCCDVLDIMQSWWALRHEPNVLLVNYRQLNDNLRGQIERIARFIDVNPPSLRMDVIVSHCSFGYMKERASTMVPFGGTHMLSAISFFHKGPQRDFRSELTPEQIARFDRCAREKLGDECALWLETGELSLFGDLTKSVESFSL